MSLTTTTIRTLGSFQLVSTKTTPIRAPPPQTHKRKPSVSRQKKSPSYASSLFSMESDLDSVMEEADLGGQKPRHPNYIYHKPAGGPDSSGLPPPRVSRNRALSLQQPAERSNKPRPAQQGASPMKPALNHSRRASTATCKGSSDVYPVPPNSTKRQSRVSFSSNDAINEYNAHHPPSASYSHPQSPARAAALGATGSLGVKNGHTPATHAIPKRQNQANQAHHQAHQGNKAHKPTSAVLAPPKPKARPPAAKSKAARQPFVLLDSGALAVYNGDVENDSSSGNSIYSDASDFPVPIDGPNTPISYPDSLDSASPKQANVSSPKTPPNNKPAGLRTDMRRTRSERAPRKPESIVTPGKGAGRTGPHAGASGQRHSYRALVSDRDSGFGNDGDVDTDPGIIRLGHPLSHNDGPAALKPLRNRVSDTSLRKGAGSDPKALRHAARYTKDARYSDRKHPVGDFDENRPSHHPQRPTLEPTLSESSFDRDRARRESKSPGFRQMSLREAPPPLPTSPVSLTSVKSPLSKKPEPFRSRFSEDSDSDYEHLVTETVQGTHQRRSSSSKFLGAFRKHSIEPEPRPVQKHALREQNIDPLPHQKHTLKGLFRHDKGADKREETTKPVSGFKKFRNMFKAL